jgi:hypothetical protein
MTCVVTKKQDVLPDDRRYWDMVIGKATDLARRYGYQRIDVPILEYTPLFARGMGTASDVFVQKEMYTIEEPDGSSITLRPEFTAGFVRAFIENGMMTWPQPVKALFHWPHLPARTAASRPLPPTQPIQLRNPGRDRPGRRRRIDDAGDEFVPRIRLSRPDLPVQQHRLPRMQTGLRQPPWKNISPTILPKLAAKLTRSGCAESAARAGQQRGGHGSDVGRRPPHR